MRLAAFALSLLLLAPPVASAAETIRLIRFSTDGVTCSFTYANSVTGENTISGDCAFFAADSQTMQLMFENLVRFHHAYWLARRGDFNDPSFMLGKTLTIDFAAANPIKVQ